MKNIFFSLALIATSLLYSQEVRIDKNNIIKIDNVELFKYVKVDLITYSFNDLNDNNLIYFRQYNNETPGFSDDDYFTLYFINEKVNFDSYGFAKFSSLLDSKKESEKIILWLVKDKVINLDGTINKEELEIFRIKYHKNLENRTTR